MAQETPTDSLVTETAKFAVMPGIDYGKGFESIISENQKWEVNLALSLFDKFRITGEYGYGLLQPSNVIRNGTYKSEGTYFRAGGEYVLTVKPKTYLSFGLMYAQANFSDHGDISIESELWNNIDQTFDRENLKGNWFEWILNTESQTFRNSESFLANVYWGTRVRIRFLNTNITKPGIDIYAIPGYGNTYSNIVPALNLFIKYRIDF